MELKAQKARVGAAFSADLTMAAGIHETVGMNTHYLVECLDPNGNLKWTEEFDNLVVNEGLDDLLNKYFKGSNYTAAFYVGLKGQGNVQATDTLEGAADGSPVNDWKEITPYSNGSPTQRPALTLGTVSGQSVSNTASKASFSIDQTATIYGAFVSTVNEGTSGTLYGAGDFASSRAVENGDTLNVTITLTASAA